VNLNTNPRITVATAMTACHIPAISIRHDWKEMRQRERGVSFNDAVSYRDSVNSMIDECGMNMGHC
jgi:hypothetical protein